MARFCHNCGNQLADDEVFCTKCGTKAGAEVMAPNVVPTANVVPTPNSAPPPTQPKPKSAIEQFVSGVKNFRRIMVLICLGIVLLAGVSSCLKGPMEVKADDMVQDYIQDQSKAEKKYKNEEVKVTGRIVVKNQFGNKNSFGVVIAYKEVGDRSYGVVIDIPADKIDIINKAKEGQFITAEGTCIGIVPQSGDPSVISIQIHADKVSQ